MTALVIRAQRFTAGITGPEYPLYPNIHGKRLHMAECKEQDAVRNLPSHSLQAEKFTPGFLVREVPQTRFPVRVFCEYPSSLFQVGSPVTQAAFGYPAGFGTGNRIG